MPNPGKVCTVSGLQLEGVGPVCHDKGIRTSPDEGFDDDDDDDDDDKQAPV